MGGAPKFRLKKIYMIGLSKTKKMNSKFQNQGFTLIEILVTVAVLSVILVIISGLFTSALKAQRKSLASQDLLAQTSYVMEYMSRQLRMARKDISGSCITVKNNYEKTNLRTLGGGDYEGPGIKFINYRGECWEFFLDENDNSLKQSKNETAPILLTSNKLAIEDFEVELAGESEAADTLQPRATFFLTIRGKSERPEAQPVIKIQTTISQRNHDFK